MNGFGLLVWREWRCNRTMLVVTIALIAVLLSMILLATAPTPENAQQNAVGDAPSVARARQRTPENTRGIARVDARPDPQAIEQRRAKPVAAIGSGQSLLGAGSVAAYLTVLFGTVLLPLVAANMIAGERADRSAEFIAALPVSRGVRLAAKGAFLAIVAAATWTPILSIAASMRTSGAIGRDEPAVLGLIATFTLLAMAIAWLAAACFESPVIAAAVAIALPPAVPLAMITVPAIGRLAAFKSQEAFYALWLAAGGMPQPLTFLVAAALFAAGSALYLRRLE